MKFYIKEYRRNNDYLVFMQEFVESCMKLKVPSIREIRKEPYLFLSRILRKIGLYRNFCKKAPLLVACDGERVSICSFPYGLDYEIVPMLWDMWPYSWSILYKDLKALKVKRAFVTVRQMAVKLHDDLGIDAYWIPEGIDVTSVIPGKDLIYRDIEIYEFGRQLPKYHKVLMSLYGKEKITTYVGNKYDKEGKLLSLAYDTNEEMYKALRNIKIMINFPQCDTNPQRAGGLETLTQRYWEAMLSKCLILGRAPQELIDLAGYNPVINIDWTNPENQLLSILDNIDKYQNLVNRNYSFAKKNASWDNRVQEIIKIMEE